MRTILQDVDIVLASTPHKTWARAHTIDQGKITKERAGSRRPLPNDSYARTLVEAIRRGHEQAAKPPDPTPPEPPKPPPYKKVAPRVAYAEGGSDARYCFFNEDGTLRPGIVTVAGGFRDDVAQYDTDGLCLGAERSPGAPSNCPTGSRQIDNRPLCSLPMQGNPELNTGSWLI